LLPCYLYYCVHAIRFLLKIIFRGANLIINAFPAIDKSLF